MSGFCFYRTTSWGVRKVCLVTQSFTELPRLRNPSNRKDFARACNMAAKEALGDAGLHGLAVFQEPRKSGKRHYHCALASATKTKMWPQMDAALTRGKLKCDIRLIVSGKTPPRPPPFPPLRPSPPVNWFAAPPSAKGPRASPLNRALRYLMAPTLTKLEVDKSPYATSGMKIPQIIIDQSAKAEKAIWAKAATPDEVYRYLQANPSISTYKALSLHVGPKVRPPHSFCYARHKPPRLPPKKIAIMTKTPKG